jgi:cytosine/adenosine deaminase-related metal-dependent hydrolase
VTESSPAERITILRAAAVATMSSTASPIIKDGAVAFDESGTIRAVGPAVAIRRQFSTRTEEIDLGRAILLPGLINAHTHLELSCCQAGNRPASFIDWITTIPARTGRDQPDFEKRIAEAAVHGARQSLRFGVTTVGDITAHPQITRPALRTGPIRVVSFGEALGLALARPRFEASLARAIDDGEASDTLSIGLSPHAPYTVDRPGYLECLRIARDRRLPLATHLAETREEAEFLQHQRGGFRDIWQRLGSWADPVDTFAGSSIEFAKAIGLLDQPDTLLAHVNYCTDKELSILSAGRATVAFCPRTHDYFGHESHRWRDMLGRGINVAVGTDSCASSPSLNLVDDLRLLRRHHADVDSSILWSLVTVNAARGLGLSGQIGSLEARKAADVVAFPVLDDIDPLRAILDDRSALPLAVWINARTRVPPV